MRKVYSYPGTKQFALLLLTCFFIVAGMGKLKAQANVGIWDSYVTIGGNEYFLGNSGNIPGVFTTNVLAKPAFSNINLGSFNPNDILTLTGGDMYSWKPTTGPGNVCGARLQVAITQTGTAPGFTAYQLNTNGPQGNKGSYFWQEYYSTALSVNVLNGLQPGTYKLLVYMSVPGSETGGDCNSTIIAPGTTGQYDTATFVIKGTVCPAPPVTGNELITNGNFNSAPGNIGFNTSYNLVTNPTGNSTHDQYLVGTAAQMLAWNTSFVSNGDASGNVNGNFMGVDGANATGINIWSETVNVIPNTVYVFSFYLCSFGGGSPANLYLYAGGSSFGSATPPDAARQWVKVTKSFCSGSNTSITLSIQDNNTAPIGNDFGLDSISLKGSATYNITAGKDTTVCTGNRVTLNGTPGACIYAWFPQASLTGDSTATPLAAPTVTTTYTLIATVPGCTNYNDTSHVVITVSNGGGGVLNVTASPDSICVGQHSTLSITNGSGSYTWLPTASLSNSTSAITTASPTITTTYTVTKGSGSCAATGQVTVTVSSGTGGVLNVTANPSAICPGDNSTLSVTSGAGTYIWSATGLTTTTNSTINVNPSITTIYTATEPGGGCAASGQVTLTVANNTIGGTVTALRDTICAGTTGTLNLTDNSSTALAWQISTTGSDFTDIGGVTATDTAKYKTTPLGASTWFRVKVGSGGCTAFSSVLELVVPPALTATFTYTAVSKTATFNANGSLGNISSYFWDFGDGATSNDKNPTHTYHNMDSSYNACLTIYDGSNCSYTYCRLITWTGINEISNSGYSIYPDPFTNQLTISTGANSKPVQSVTMYDVLGQQVLNTTLNNNRNTTLQLNATNLARGMYYVVIKTADATYMQKVVKQ